MRKVDTALWRRQLWRDSHPCLNPSPWFNSQRTRFQNRFAGNFSSKISLKPFSHLVYEGFLQVIAEK